MGSKRSPDHDDGPASKRRRGENQTSSRPGKSINSGIDQTYGQRGAFGSLDDATTTVPSWDSDLDCEDDSDALAYLRSVRVQAGGIPHVIVAQKAGPQPPPQSSTDHAATQEREAEEQVDRSIYHNGVGDSRGYYYDGAYTAVPEWYQGGDGDSEDGEDGEVEAYGDGDSSASSEDGRPHNSNSDEIRDAYYAALTRQYMSLRTLLRTEPPPTAVASLTSSSPTQVGNLGPGSSTFSRWTGLIKATDPLPAQVASMRKDSVVRLLRVLLGSKSFREGYELRERTSRWIWALLARLPDRGELDYQEIGWIRELGKRAVLFMMSMTEREVLHDQYGVGGGGESDEDVEVEVDEGLEEPVTPGLEDEDNEPFVNAREDGLDDGPDEAEADGTTIDENASCYPGPKTVPHLSSKQPTGAERSTIPSLPGRDNIAEQASDVEMQLESDPGSDLEDGEVPGAPLQEKSPPREEKQDHEADIESVKARLLSRLEEGEDEGEEGGSEGEGEMEEHPESEPEPEPEPTLTPAQEEAARARVNLRATLNMILTVAGEFYGQRDLLEFRNPFSRLGEDV